MDLVRATSHVRVDAEQLTLIDGQVSLPAGGVCGQSAWKDPAYLDFGREFFSSDESGGNGL